MSDSIKPEEKRRKCREIIKIGKAVLKANGHDIVFVCNDRWNEEDNDADTKH